MLNEVDPASVLSQRSIRMLLVEDSEDDAFLLSAELRARGARVVCQRVDTASDMAVALADSEWDVIICDHQMPAFDSLSALDVLKRSGKDIPFIIYSGCVNDSLGTDAMQRGVQDYVPKGNVTRLLPVLDRELRGAAARRAVRQADSRIRSLSLYDSLSNLPNHHFFRSRVEELLREAEDRGAPPRGALVYVDLDRFIRVNGSFGYEAGSRILRLAAERLVECNDHQGIVARLGGDEFGIFLPGVSGGEANVFADWILHAFDSPFDQDDIEIYLTASIGVAIAPEHGRDAYTLLTNAEAAMAQAKRAGGNSVCSYRRELNVSSAERLALEMDLRHSAERAQLLLHYQPIVDAGSGRTIAVEALVRWDHPDQGRMEPDRFIPVADESGLIVEIGEWVLREACARCRSWHEAGLPNIGVSVNVSAVQFAQPKLLQTVQRVLAQTGLAPDRLILEITETVLMRDGESTIGMLRALKNMGVRISIDDFGTGYSSLGYLKRFPVDILKVDRSFVRDAMRQAGDAAIVRAIVGIARSMGLTTVAEGVETIEQIEFLRDEGCNRLQGFYFSRPADAAQVVERLSAECKEAVGQIH